jgi:hypothetical protein
MSQHPEYFPPWTSTEAYRKQVDSLTAKRAYAFKLLCRFLYMRGYAPTARELEQWAITRQIHPTGDSSRGFLARRLSEVRDLHNLVRWGVKRECLETGNTARTWEPHPARNWRPKDPYRIFIVFDAGDSPMALEAVCSRMERAVELCTTRNHCICERRLNEELSEHFPVGYFPLREEEAEKRSALQPETPHPDSLFSQGGP